MHRQFVTTAFGKRVAHIEAARRYANHFDAEDDGFSFSFSFSFAPTLIV